jgi:hypothetical protein
MHILKTCYGDCIFKVVSGYEPVIRLMLCRVPRYISAGNVSSETNLKDMNSESDELEGFLLATESCATQEPTTHTKYSAMQFVLNICSKSQETDLLSRQGGLDV